MMSVIPEAMISLKFISARNQAMWNPSSYESVTLDPSSRWDDSFFES
jgi:hypothetical protein